jgi:hypothetical protein
VADRGTRVALSEYVKSFTNSLEERLT